MKTILLLRIEGDNFLDIKGISALVCEESSSSIEPSIEQCCIEHAKLKGVESKKVDVLHTLNLEEWVGDNADRKVLLQELASISGFSPTKAHAFNDLLSLVADTAYARGVDYGYDTW